MANILSNLDQDFVTKVETSATPPIVRTVLSICD